MFTVYAIDAEGHEYCVSECATLAEAAEYLLDLVSDAGSFADAPEPGDPDPATLPPCYGIRFNTHHAMELHDALTSQRAPSDASRA